MWLARRASVKIGECSELHNIIHNKLYLNEFLIFTWQHTPKITPTTYLIVIIGLHSERHSANSVKDILNDTSIKNKSDLNHTVEQGD